MDADNKVLVKQLLESMPISFFQIVPSIEKCFELQMMSIDAHIERLKAYDKCDKGPNKKEEIHERECLLLGRHVCEEKKIEWIDPGRRSCVSRAIYEERIKRIDSEFHEGLLDLSQHQV
ncbi:hypothetical protein E3N88_07676 [Mikania micrantha]|uniref:Uncharacterized protein n=1 Tax=Mikania micrantha TaxID=192012 RepID=A0A5N6PG23_9ASTR|nr:hypothetical protein E3N88_07676 [Mikania micrantha]